MCGIAGIIQPGDKAAQLLQVRRMMEALAHRGPDGQGTWQREDGSVTLGHRRLAIIDLSPAGDQPLSFLGRYHIIHNGEIYNYPELKQVLEAKGYSFRSKTDTEVIAAAYDCWGKDCLQQLEGMFAFAIWDNQEQLLFAARDRFGEKPFYYQHTSQGLVFASELKALWAAGVERTLNRCMLFNFITIGYTDNPADTTETFYESVNRLPPATSMEYRLSTKSLELKKYWALDPEKENSHIADGEALERFRELLTLSVQRRLRSDVPIGTSLSGGLDSSSIAWLAKPEKVFTAAFPGYEKDESAIAAGLAAAINARQFTTVVTGDELSDDWEKLCASQEEPFGSASIYAQYRVYALAAEKGIKVLLDGQGADETLAGYDRYYKWFWQELFRKRKLFRSKELKAARALGVKASFDYRNMIAAYFPSFASVVLERHYLLKAIRQEDLDPAFARLQSREAYYTPPEYFTLNGALYFNTCIHGLEELLRYADRNAMAHGREVRLPFLSHELVEFVFSLPAKYKIREGRTKWILRQTMNHQLPDAINWRTDKVGFEPPQASWMQQKNMQERVWEARKKLVAEKILKSSVLQKPVQALGSHAADNYDWRYLAAAPFL